MLTSRANSRAIGFRYLLAISTVVVPSISLRNVVFCESVLFHMFLASHSRVPQLTCRSRIQGGREEDTSDGRDDISHEKRHEIERKKHEKRKKNHPIKRLPTFLVRNKAPCGNPAFERLINVALLGIHRHDSAESAYLEKLSDRLVQAFYDAGGREDRKLSRAAFAFFLTRVQGDRVVGNPPAREEYTYKEFLEEWTVKYGLGALGALRPEQKDLSKPISNYFISSSHNTYLEGHQLYSQSSSQIYQKVWISSTLDP